MRQKKQYEKRSKQVIVQAVYAETVSISGHVIDKRGCQWNGDCDHCGASDCIATDDQCESFYAREAGGLRRRIVSNKQELDDSWPPHYYGSHRKGEFYDL